MNVDPVSSEELADDGTATATESGSQPETTGDGKDDEHGVERDVRSLPVLPVKNTVLFPYLIMPLSVGRPASVAAVKAALATEEKEIVVVTQRDSSIEEPSQDDVYAIGTRAIIKKHASRSDILELIVQGTERVVLIKVDREDDYMRARVRSSPVPLQKNLEIEALRREVLELATRAHELSRPQMAVEFQQLVSSDDDPMRLVYLLGSVISLEQEKEQSLLEATTVSDALRLMFMYLTHEVQVLELRQQIVDDAQTEMTRQQREYLLRQQLRAIQQELGEEDGEAGEVHMLRERLEKAHLPEEVHKDVEKELKRLEKVPSASPEHNVIRSYVELVLELPWNKMSESEIDIAKARTVLDEDHYDLKEVKERILEHLGVLKLNPEAKAPILCFVGPPGVGKTSLGQSIARALGRNFQRMSLGGMHDEAELRGHRRTYIGAMPGRIIQSIRRAGVRNPLVMLDEVDKLGRDFRGDPAAALLEILDPEQNKDFRDNYLDLPFDLSKVFFVTTANTLGSIPRPLLDRMEVLRLPGYSEEEKTEIARRFLLPRQLLNVGLDAKKFSINDEALRQVITRWTREAGVRQLERTIARLARKVALRFAEGNTRAARIQSKDLPGMLGPEVFFLEKMRQDSPPGVSTGLAWTEAGGDVLYIESTLLPDSKDLTLTGQLGDIMKESAKAADSWVRSHAQQLGIPREAFQSGGVHIHLPAGAIPKDGPSAGVALVTALASLYLGVAARTDTAMTGEITLAGLVLPVGGVKEKVLAAKRAGIKRVVLPKVNKKDLQDLPEHVEKDMEFIFVENIQQALKATLPSTGKPKTVEKKKPKQQKKTTAPKKTASKKATSRKSSQRQAAKRSVATRKTSARRTTGRTRKSGR